MTKLRFNVKSKAPLYLLLGGLGQLVFTVSPAPKAAISRGKREPQTKAAPANTHLRGVRKGTPWPLPECIPLLRRAAKRQSHSLPGRTLALPVI